MCVEIGLFFGGSKAIQRSAATKWTVNHFDSFLPSIMVSLDCNAKTTEGKELNVLRKLQTCAWNILQTLNLFMKKILSYLYFGVPTECSSALLEFAQKTFCFELEVE